MFKAGDGPTESPKDQIFTAEQLIEFNGSDESKPIYLAVKGTIYDVTKARAMYGATGNYKNFAGKDASRALGKSSVKIEDCNWDYSGLTSEELKVLDDWENLYKRKYNIVGKIKF